MSDPKRTAEKAQLKAEKESRYAALLEQLPAFVEFGKISRLNRDITITEKIDGTNAAIGITDDGRVYAQSRTRVITPEQDNFGFAAWVMKNADELSRVLGPGLHFGEWWGSGIQRGYGLIGRRFSLFNYERWANDPSVAQLASIGVQVIPILYHGPWNTNGQYYFAPDLALKMLAQRGSFAQPGYKLEPIPTAQEITKGYFQERFTGKWFKSGVGPEGIVVYHKHGRVLFKATLEHDEQHKFEKPDALLLDPDNTDEINRLLTEAAKDDEFNPEAS